MKIAIMGAMREEIDPILETVETYETPEYAGNVFYTCTYGAHELVLPIQKSVKFFRQLRHR